MKEITVVIRSVDSYGFNGREFHPKADDVGRIGVVRSMATYNGDSAEQVMRLTADDERAGMAYSVLTTQMVDVAGNLTDQILELMDFEVEIVGFEEPTVADYLQHVLTEHGLWSDEHTYTMPDGTVIERRQG